MLEQRIDGHLVALHDIEHAVGQAGLLQQFRQRSEATGSRSEGFSTKVLPQASASGNIHIGTITGKVERRDAGDHAQRLAQGPVVDAGRRPGR